MIEREGEREDVMQNYLESEKSFERRASHGEIMKRWMTCGPTATPAIDA
jgi:hypothetical protein